MSGLGYEWADRYPEVIRSTTAAEVTAAARRYLASGRYTRVAVGKKDAASGGSAKASAPSN
jgi:predicted Zn-dependent peptidase